MILLIVSLVLWGQSSSANAPTIEYKEVRAVKVSVQETRYLDLITELNKCENYGLWNDNSPQDGKTKSYGGLQFKRDTFLGYGYKSGVLPKWVDTTNFEKYIYDRDIQTAIAHYMIEIGVAPTYQGWFNCFRNPKYNLSQYL